MEDQTLKIKNFIIDISRIQEKNSFDFHSINECIKEYDFSVSEKDQLEQIHLSHKNRSEESLHAKNLNSAIISMERAVEINPLSDEYRNHMAQLYLMRANREGFKKSDRDLAYNSANFSLKLNKNNPIASSLLKEIRKKDHKISGRDLNRKLIPPLAAIFVILALAIFMKSPFTIPFLSKESESIDEEWIKPEVLKTKPFTERKIDLEILSSLSRDFDIQFSKSLIAKTNGSYSYTIQGEIQSPEEALESADLRVNFIGYEGNLLFKKEFPLVREDQIILPGESIMIDEFFYIHYLPPDIDKITINLTNISFTEDFISNSSSEAIYLQWDAYRPEGTNISLILKNDSIIKSYSGSYLNMKIELNNNGTEEIKNLEVELGWKDKYGTVLLERPEVLIRKDSLPLSTGKNRIYYLFTEIPEQIALKNEEFYIKINRIN